MENNYRFLEQDIDGNDYNIEEQNEKRTRTLNDERKEHIKKNSNNESKEDPDYNYIKKVPRIIGYKKKSNMFDTMYTIEDNLARTSGILITGSESCPIKKKKKDLRLGELSYFTSGKCGENSTPECVDKPRNIIVDNSPFTSKGNKGLIPSIINDFMAFEPVEVLKSMNGSGYIVNDKCSLKNIKVKQYNPGAKTFIRNETLCVSDITLPVKNNIDLQESFVSNNDENKTIKYFTIFLLISLIGVLSYKRSSSVF